MQGMHDPGLGTEALRVAAVTAARNAGNYIEKTILSVIRQDVRPVQWVIISDSSTDATDSIIDRYVKHHNWISHRRVKGAGSRALWRKAKCISAGLAEIPCGTYDVVANIDADISFGPHVFRFLLSRLSSDRSLGVAGVGMIEGRRDSRNDKLFFERDVFGALQFFRRECFEQIGGYRALKQGGVDWLAVRMARMRGWKTQTFKETAFVHHHPMGTSDKGIWYARYQYGKKDYAFGNSAVWELSRVLVQMTHHPVGIGGLVLLLGYMSSWLNKQDREIPKEVIAFHRREQRSRLLALYRSLGARLLRVGYRKDRLAETQVGKS